MTGWSIFEPFPSTLDTSATMAKRGSPLRDARPVGDQRHGVCRDIVLLAGHDTPRSGVVAGIQKGTGRLTENWSGEPGCKAASDDFRCSFAAKKGNIVASLARCSVG